MPYYFLRIGSDFLEDAAAYRSKASAVAVFAEVAKELAGYGQAVEASIQIAPNRDEVAEYPDFVLSLGPRGGVRVEAA